MSITLYIHYKNPNVETKMYPVAGELEFSRHWVEPAKQLDLPLIEMMYDGLIIDDVEDIKKAIQELYMFKAYWEPTVANQPDFRFQIVLERIKKILKVLEDTVNEWDLIEDVTIG